MNELELKKAQKKINGIVDKWLEERNKILKLPQEKQTNLIDVFINFKKELTQLTTEEEKFYLSCYRMGSRVNDDGSITVGTTLDFICHPELSCTSVSDPGPVWKCSSTDVEKRSYTKKKKTRK
jgi:hypothetical protein